jgi:hypothetical protein
MLKDQVFVDRRVTRLFRRHLWVAVAADQRERTDGTLDARDSHPVSCRIQWPAPLYSGVGVCRQRRRD